MQALRGVENPCLRGRWKCEYLTACACVCVCGSIVPCVSLPNTSMTCSPLKHKAHNSQRKLYNKRGKQASKQANSHLMSAWKLD